MCMKYSKGIGSSTDQVPDQSYSFVRPRNIKAHITIHVGIYCLTPIPARQMQCVSSHVSY
jgi:hypothetical protein